MTPEEIDRIVTALETKLLASIGKCELCEVRDQEVKRHVRAKRSVDEAMEKLVKENEALLKDRDFLWRELQIQLGRLGRSAQFSAAQAQAGITWEGSDVIEDPVEVIKPHKELKEGFVERVVAYFKSRDNED
jgi:hypothetical protein